MALSDDQKALLRLLAQREEGYEDIAALLGLSVGEVRARVKESLAELESAAGPSVEPGPEVAAAQAPEPAPPKPPPTPPPPPAAPERAAEEDQPQPRPPAAERPSRRRLSMPNARRRLIELAGGVVVLILLVLFATGAVSLGGEDSDSGSADEASNRNREVTQAVLTPPGGGEASGRAVFGRVGKDPVLQISAEGLEPSPIGQSYTVWLYRSPKLALRIGGVKVGDAGGIAAQFPIPVELLSYVAGGAFDQIRLSLTPNAAYKAEIAQAKRQKRLPAYTGETVLGGEISGPLAEQRQSG